MREHKLMTPPHPALFGRRKPAMFVKTDLFCPYCGKQDMWQEHGDTGDFYLGVSTNCESCTRVTHTLDEQWEER